MSDVSINKAVTTTPPREVVVVDAPAAAPIGPLTVAAIDASQAKPGTALVPVSAAGKEVVAANLARSLVANPLSDAEREGKISQYYAQLDWTNRDSILTFGGPATDKVAKFADQMTEGVRNKDAGDAGALIRGVLGTAKGFTPEITEKAAGVVSRFFRAKQNAEAAISDFWQRYVPVRDQVQSVSDTLSRKSTEYQAKRAQFEVLKGMSIESAVDLELYMEAAKRYATHLEDNVRPQIATEAEQALQTGTNKVVAAARPRELNNAITDLQRQIAAIETGITLAEQQIPTLDLIIQNQLNMVGKIAQIKTITLPAWKQMLVANIEAFAQQKDVDLANLITDTTEDFMVRTSAAVKGAAVSSAKMAERAVVSPQAIREVNANLIAAYQEIDQITRDAATLRQTASTEINASREQLAKAMAGRILPSQVQA
ncbi:MAG: toxic anion resistance protein [Myxococcota bacterium]|nr:toxic anion resistance protein [Myxococcota bacterium]